VKDTDCPGAQVCNKGVCEHATLACSQDGDCPNRHVCVAGKCRQPSAWADEPETEPATAAEPAPAAPAASAPATVAPASAFPEKDESDGFQAGPWPWILIGTGAAALIAGIVLVAVGEDQIAEADAACPAHQSCPPEIADSGNEGRTMRTAGAVLSPVGSALGITGMILGIVALATDNGSAAPGQPSALFARTAITGHGQGLSLGGTF
jgi:hypothetical protein